MRRLCARSGRCLGGIEVFVFGVRALGGFTPKPRVPFLCFAKEKEPKERRPRCLRPWLRQGCPVLLRTQGPRKTRCVRFAHSAPTVARVSSRSVPAARGPGFLRCSVWHRGNSKQPNTQHPNTEQPGLTPSRRFPAVRLLDVWAAAPMRCREAQLGWAARASARFPTDSARLSERSERSERSEFRAGPVKRAPQGTPWRSQGAAHRGLTFWFLLGQAKRNSPAGARPGGLSRKET